MAEQTLDVAVPLTGMDWILSEKKRDIDFALSIAFLPGALCVGAATSAAVYLETGVNPILVQDREGTGGANMRMIKIRSHSSATDFNEIFLPEHMNRLSKIGKFSKATHLDEVLQIVNVLRGDMSFFGPRPLLHMEIEEMRRRLCPSEFEAWYEPYRASIKGIFGLYQFHCGQYAVGSVEAMRGRCEWDLEYFETASEELDKKLAKRALIDIASKMLRRRS